MRRLPLISALLVAIVAGCATIDELDVGGAKRVDQDERGEHREMPARIGKLQGEA